MAFRREVPPRHAQFERKFRAKNAGRHLGAGIPRLKVQELRAAFRLLAERNHRRAVAACVRRKPLELLIALGQDSHPALLQAFEDLGLRIGDTGKRVEELDVDRRNAGDDGEVRAHEARQRRDLARVVHADLEYAEAGSAWHPRERQRHAPEVVVGFFGGVG